MTLKTNLVERLLKKRLIFSLGFSTKSPAMGNSLFLSFIYLYNSYFFLCRPSQGQANWFLHYHPEKIPGAIARYVNETKRIYGIVNNHLKDREFFVTDHFTIVDAAFYPWVRTVGYTGFDFETEFKSEYPHVYAWAKRIETRPSVVKTYSEFSH